VIVVGTGIATTVIVIIIIIIIIINCGVVIAWLEQL
jgi:hypothetical protein